MTAAGSMAASSPVPQARPVRAGEPLMEIRGLCVDYGSGPDAVHAVTDASLVLRRRGARRPLREAGR